MKISNSDKKYILNEHLRNIHHISDKEYQRRIWLRGEGPECGVFDETCCHFFDDEFKTSQEFRISPAQTHHQLHECQSYSTHFEHTQ